MAIWTTSAQEGTGGDQVAAELAASAGVPLLDRQTLARFAHADDRVDQRRDLVGAVWFHALSAASLEQDVEGGG